MRIYLTGIPGSGTRQVLEQLVTFARERERSVRVVSIADKTFEFARDCGYQIHPAHIISVIPGIQELIRGGGFARAIEEVERATEDLVIIDSHACFNYDGLIVPSADERFITKLAPDLFVTIIDAEWRIRRHLAEHPMWREFAYSDSAVIGWQVQEVNYTAMHARYANKSHLVFSASQALELLYKRAFYPEMPLIYASYAMSNADAMLVERRNKFLVRLQRFFAAVDPRYVELAENPDKDLEVDEDLFKVTVLCDLRWWVEQASRVVAFNPGRVYSSGMNSEMLHARAYTIPVTFITPERSPFTSNFIAHEQFADEHAFFASLLAQGYREIDIYDRDGELVRVREARARASALL